MQTPLQKPVTVTRDPLSFHRNVPEAPGTPPSETNTPSTSAAATARTPGPSTGHGSEGNIARNGRLVIEQTEEGGAGRGEAGPSDERGSETETEEVKGDSEDTSAESEDRGEGANTGQSRAEEVRR